ncbi:putative ATP-grasp-modified RiPP [Nonomuraea sp. NPDC000554]|uniref:putative ATP-grasp-modified RiPP n=1 Tax=Nonomuraea sp. NPDC000554 TaxID=3154259 RepID=UPI00332820E0
MHASSPARTDQAPWGMTRLSPFPRDADTGVPYRVELDPVTQTGVHLDLATGRPLDAGRHGTNKQQASATEPPHHPDGDAPKRGGKPDSVTDWVSD